MFLKRPGGAAREREPFPYARRLTGFTQKIRNIQAGNVFAVIAKGRSPCSCASIDRRPNRPPGNLEVVDGPPEGGKIPELDGNHGAFAPQEIFEIAAKLHAKSR